MCNTKVVRPAFDARKAAANGGDKKPQVLRNPYLDGVDPLIRAKQGGLGALRIDRDPAVRGSSGTARIARTTPTTGASPAIVSLAINRTA